MTSTWPCGTSERPEVSNCLPTCFYWSVLTRGSWCADAVTSGQLLVCNKKVKVAHTRLPSAGFRS